jgi:hypothetical protein
MKINFTFKIPFTTISQMKQSSKNKMDFRPDGEIFSAGFFSFGYVPVLSRRLFQGVPFLFLEVIRG